VFPGPILLVDGMTGSGKTMLVKTLDTLPNFFTPKFNYSLEQLCILASLGSIERSDAQAFIRLIIDQDRFDYSLSREINFRLFDLSSVWKSKKILSYLTKLTKENSQEQELITSPKGLIYVIHQLLEKALPIETAYPNDVLQILCIRHPLYVFDHWMSYIDNHGRNPRDFTLCRIEQELEIPWFIESSGHLYANANNADRSALAIAELTLRSIALKHSKKESRIITIDFEKFVLDPRKYLKKLQNYYPFDLEKANRTLNKENIPRKHINLSIQKKVYKRYKSTNLDSKLAHKSDYLFNLTRIKPLLSPEVWKLMQCSIEAYEEEFGLWFD
jgi:hypothetical protein